MRRHVHKLQWKCKIYQINSAICKEKLCDFASADNMTGKLNKPPNRSHHTTSFRNLGVIFDDQQVHIAKTARSCRFCIAQHQKDQALPYTARRTTSYPGPCHFYTELLQCSSSWTSIMHSKTVTDDSKCSSTIGLQLTQKGPCHTSLCLPALSSGCSTHWVQYIDACI